jgi:hypothetical protein
MFNLIAYAYTNAAARNPGPYLLFSLIFFCMLLGLLFWKAMTGPDPYAYYKTREYAAELQASIKRDEQAKWSVYDYCKEKKLPPWVFVNTKIDGKEFTNMCSMGRPRPATGQ